MSERMMEEGVDTEGVVAPDLARGVRFRKKKRATNLFELAGVSLPELRPGAKKDNLKPDGRRRKSRKKKNTPYRRAQKYISKERAAADHVGKVVRIEDDEGGITLVEVGRQSDVVSGSGKDGQEARRDTISPGASAPRLSELDTASRRVMFGIKSGGLRKKAKVPKGVGSQYDEHIDNLPSRIQVRKNPAGLGKLADALRQALGK